MSTATLKGDIATKLGKFAQASMGSNGADFVSDALEHTPAVGYVYTAIQVIEDAVIASYAPLFGGNTMIGVTLIAGTIIYGMFTSIQLTSGKVIAYKGE